MNESQTGGRTDGQARRWSTNNTDRYFSNCLKTQTKAKASRSTTTTTTTTATATYNSSSNTTARARTNDSREMDDIACWLVNYAKASTESFKKTCQHIRYFQFFKVDRGRLLSAVILFHDK